jgi:hypothetical protein
VVTGTGGGAYVGRMPCWIMTFVPAVGEAADPPIMTHGINGGPAASPAEQYKNRSHLVVKDIEEVVDEFMGDFGDRYRFGCDELRN